MSADGVEYYAYLRSLAVDHDIEFTDEFKAGAVRLVLDEGKSVGAAARDRIDLRERAEAIGIDQRHVVDAVHGQRQRQAREALLQLAVFIVGNQVDGTHALDFGAKLLVPQLDALEVARGIVKGEQHFRAIDGVAQGEVRAMRTRVSNIAAAELAFLRALARALRISPDALREIEGAVAACIATFGAVDIVHNNVGIGHVKR